MSAPKFTQAALRVVTVPTSIGICHKIGPLPAKPGTPTDACIYSDHASVGGDVEQAQLAYAHLFAAAPTLYAALSNLLKRAMEELADPTDVAEVRAAVAALAKARGEA